MELDLLMPEKDESKTKEKGQLVCDLEEQFQMDIKTRGLGLVGSCLKPIGSFCLKHCARAALSAAC